MPCCHPAALAPPNVQEAMGGRLFPLGEGSKRPSSGLGMGSLCHGRVGSDRTGRWFLKRTQGLREEVQTISLGQYGPLSLAQPQMPLCTLQV